MLPPLAPLLVALAAMGQTPPPPPPDRTSRMTAGLVAGLLSALLLQPLEVVKSRLQVRKPSEPKGSVPMLAHVLREGGAAALWAGVTPSIVRLAGGIALYFFFLGETEVAMRSAFGALTGGWAALANFALGASSRAMAMVVFCPITVLKTRAEVRGSSQGGLFRELADLARTEGSAGLFAGLGAALLRDVPYSGFNLLLLRSIRGSPFVVALPSAIQSAAAGAAAASCSTLLTQPADVIRTQQVLSTQKDKRLSSLTVLAQIYRTSGPLALYAGVTARVAMRAVQQALTWGVFEALVGGRA